VFGFLRRGTGASIQRRRERLLPAAILKPAKSRSLSVHRRTGLESEASQLAAIFATIILNMR
jgi:hypothetical protein